METVVQEVFTVDDFLQAGVANFTEPGDFAVCFLGAWNEREARFNACFVPLAATVPAAIAVLILLCECLRVLTSWTPRWTRPFIEEYAGAPELNQVVPKRRWSSFSAILISLSVIAFALQLAVVVRTWISITFLSFAFPSLAVLGLLFLHLPWTAPYSVLAIFVFQVLAQLVLLTSGGDILDLTDRKYYAAALVFSLLSITLILFMPLRDPRLPHKEISRPFTEPTSELRSPEDNLSLWQFMTVAWMNPMIRNGSKRQLQDEDVWSLPYKFQHQRLHDNFRLLKGTVVQRLIRANIIDIVILVSVGVSGLVLEYSAPLLLQKLLASMEDINAPRRASVVYAALSLMVRVADAQLSVVNLWFERRCYERCRGEMITMLYEKALGRKISFGSNAATEVGSDSEGTNGHAVSANGTKKEGETWFKKMRTRTSAFFKRRGATATVKQPASMGKILNLMRNDVYEVAQRFWEIQQIVQKPLSVLFSVFLVVDLLGWPSLMAVGAVVIAQLINVVLARIMVYYEKKRRVATDEKLQVITQFVEALRHLRWYGWQGSWLSQIMTARQKELNLRVISSLWNLMMSAANIISLEMTPVIAFWAYTVIAGRELRVDLAFPAMEVFAKLTSNLRDLPQLIVVVINAWVAVGRIEDFMAEPDRKEMSTEALVGDSMAFDHASFAWPGSCSPTLTDIDLRFPEGMTVVCGEVASGKTAMLQALLGEMDMLDGQLIRPQEPIGYCTQTPWLQSMSIRENILFGSSYEDKRYKDVLDACALTPDLLDFKAGDLSLIGENGIGLSGGQRARIALARAVYSEAKILLLDDPLSALDQQTAEAIVQKCLAGPLVAGRTIVLVTHRTDLVFGIADLKVQMENGKVSILDDSQATEDSLRHIISAQSQTNSESQKQLDDRNATAVPEKFIEDEHRAHGNVQASVYWEYIKAGKLKWWSILMIQMALHRLSITVQSWFLKTWGEAYNSQGSYPMMFLLSQNLSTAAYDPTFGLPPPNENINPWLLGFFLLALVQVLFFLLSQVIMIIIVYTAGKNMFRQVMEKVSGATFRFYDVTPVGRLMNRMTSDISVVDGNISMHFLYISWTGIAWVSSIIIIASVTPTFLAFAAVLGAAFVIFFVRFLPTSQSLRRLEMVSLTPLISNFGALLNGLSTVRAFRAQRQFQEKVIHAVDTFQKMDHFYWSLQVWLMYRYDVISAISTFLMTMLALGTNLSPGLTAFVLLAAEKFVSATHKLCKQYGQLQMDFVSVERIVELLHLEQEPQGSIYPPVWWPSPSGDVVFDDVTIKYAPHLDPALSGISFTVKGGSKTAVIGRTGSGKSTLALAMLATVLADNGQIMVDSIDLADVDKQLLRTRVTFLAQDPVLFPGTMRQNLDPVEEHSDEECGSVLRRVCERQGWSLDTTIEAGGRNLSQGQRQLVGLARAVLRRSAIIILDEATASIDGETAMQIQQVMHEEMQQSTVITIAHRLEAVRNADYCIVLGHGRILQQGPAAEMLAAHQNEMVRNTDDDEAAQ